MLDSYTKQINTLDTTTMKRTREKLKKKKKKKKTGKKRTTKKRQNRSAALGRPALKLLIIQHAYSVCSIQFLKNTSVRDC